VTYRGDSKTNDPIPRPRRAGEERGRLPEALEALSAEAAFILDRLARLDDRPYRLGDSFTKAQRT
jgi:hypothetical protein